MIFNDFQTRTMYRVGWIPEGSNASGSGDGLLEYVKTFRVQLQTRQVCPPRDVAPRVRQARDEAAPYRIGDEPDHDGYSRRGLLGCQGGWRGRGENEVYLEVDKTNREIGKAILFSLGVSDLNGRVLALNPAELAEPLPECLQVRRAWGC
jgi:hypothetical protein